MSLEYVKFIGFSDKKLKEFLDSSNYIFWDWIKNIKNTKDLEYIKIYSKDAVKFGKEYGRIQVFVKFKNLYKGVITLRKKAVAIGVFVLADDIYQINVKQFRYPVLGDTEEIVAGLVDYRYSLENTIKKELIEELGLEENTRIYEELNHAKPIFIKGLYPSIGDSSEMVYLYAIFLKASKQDVDNLCKSKGGNKEEKEYTKTSCIKGLNDILNYDYIDAKGFIINLWFKNLYLEFKNSSFKDFKEYILDYVQRT